MSNILQVQFHHNILPLRQVKTHMELQLPGAVLTQENYCNLQYEIKQSKCQVADIFTVLQQAKPLLGLLDYAVHQTNLEQVSFFLKFSGCQTSEFRGEVGSFKSVLSCDGCCLITLITCQTVRCTTNYFQDALSRNGNDIFDSSPRVMTFISIL